MSSTLTLVRPTIQNPVDPGRRISAVLFDLDGTMYDQRRMRALMAAELLALPLTRPSAARRVWKGLSAYRRAQEALRDTGRSRPIARDQLESAARETRIPTETLAPIVEEWMHERPLKHMASCRATGLQALLAFLERSGLSTGVLSDYPAVAKLHALGIAQHFSLILSAVDPEINAFKPSPRGFLVACARWGLDPGDVLFVGDRCDVDAAGAAAAGMPCVIVSRKARSADPHNGVLTVDSLESLHGVLDGRR